MFSVTLALIAIFGIALMNLFLGFASAMVLGRGPKTWSDIDNGVTVRYFSPRLAFPRATRAAQPAESAYVPDATAAVKAVAPQEPAKTETAAPGATSVADDKLHLVSPAKPVTSPAKCVAWDATTQKLVLPPKASAPPADDGTPEVLFAPQLEAWKASQPREETPCLSGIVISVQDASLDDQTRAALMNAVHASIVGQLRKDRRVLRIADNQFIWFSPDVHPDDGLAPVERTRQILCNTRFLHQDNALAVAVQAAVIAVSIRENPPFLIQRLTRTLQYAQERGEGPTCVDVGHGPEFVQPAKLDLDEIECVLA